PAPAAFSVRRSTSPARTDPPPAADTLRELHAYAVGRRPVQVGEDGQGPLPRVARRPGVTGGAVGVAEPVERERLQMAVADETVQLDGPAVAGHRPVEVAEAVMGVAET